MHDAWLCPACYQVRCHSLIHMLAQHHDGCVVTKLLTVVMLTGGALGAIRNSKRRSRMASATTDSNSAN